MKVKIIKSESVRNRTKPPQTTPDSPATPLSSLFPSKGEKGAVDAIIEDESGFDETSESSVKKQWEKKKKKKSKKK
jgi:hypothetical protein